MKDYKFFVFINDIPYRLDADKARDIFEELGIGSGWVEKEDIPDLSSRYPKQGTAIYGYDILEEKAATFNSGYVRPTGKTVKAPYMSNVQVLFPNLASYELAKVPWRYLYGNVMEVPFQGFHSSGHTTAVGYNPFVPVTLYGGNATTFMYIGKKPTFVHMKGTITVCMRVNRYDTDEQLITRGYTRMMLPNARLILRPTTRTLGESNYEWTLGVGAAGEPFKFDGRQPFKMPRKTYDELTALIGNKTPKIIKRIRGSLLPRRMDTDFGYTTSDHLMTDWFEVGPETQYHLSVDKGKGRTCTVQWMDNTGRIYYDEMSSITSNSPPELTINRIINIPPFATRGRIFYRHGDNPNKDTEEATRLYIRPVPEEYDPFYGVWTRYVIPVDHLLQFDPGYKYSFRWGIGDRHRMAIDKHGFIIEGSDISFDINSRDYFQDILNENSSK